MDEHPHPRSDRVLVHLERVGAVLERVLDADRAPRELAGLARRREAAAERIGERAAEDEAPGLGAEHELRAARLGERGELVDRLRRPCASASSGMMSLNTIPGRGKSGTSRISAVRS